MVKKRWLFIIFAILSLLPFSSAVHNITGFVNDSFDEISADGRIITLWNFSGGVNNNLTDTIGVGGRSERANAYSIDCELLTGGCIVGDILTLKVFNLGDGYATEEKNITVTGAAFDSPTNMTLNTPPEAYPISPVDHGNVSTSTVLFNCSLVDPDDNLQNVTLYGNWSVGWQANETKTVTGDQDYVTFSKTIDQGIYEYGCFVFDNVSIGNYSSNNTFTVDLTQPSISSIMINESYTCGINSQVRVNCTTTDEILTIDQVILQKITPSAVVNYSGIFLGDDTWYADIFVDELGTWKFNCIVNDTSGNEQNLTSPNFQGASNLPDLYINYTSIYLNNTSPMENETILINATVENLGCGIATDTNISFFNGDPGLGGEHLGNHTLTIPGMVWNGSNITWITGMGFRNFFVYADYGNSIIEYNETNNQGNKSFSINSWQEIYGNVSIEKLIGVSGGNLERWQNISFFNGNIFLTDSESDIDWVSLQALGRTIGGGASTNDFSEIDSILNMQNFEDSISNEYTIGQTPKKTETFYIHDDNITDVPYANSTENNNFITGILWDYSDDIDSDGEYDSTDEEDIVFVGKISQQTQGAYGIYDYEVSIPAKLREYKTVESSQIYLYYDLN